MMVKHSCMNIINWPKYGAEEYGLHVFKDRPPFLNHIKNRRLMAIPLIVFIARQLMVHIMNCMSDHPV